MYTYTKYGIMHIYKVGDFMRIAFLFAGQGSQYVGMGKDVCENYPIANEIFKKANQALGFDIESICFNDAEKINVTEFTQPAVVTVSVALLEVLKSKGVKADAVAGLSLGEYTAAYGAGAMKFEDLVKLVNVRGKIMQDAVPSGVGKMAVVLGMADQDVVDVCKQASTETSIVEPANFNCPGQVVVGGHIDAVDRFAELAKEAGAKRILPLAVSVPSHTSVMNEAATKFAPELAKVELANIAVDFYANVTGQKQTTEEIKANMEKQMSNATQMGKTIINMINDGIDMFVEIGPGKALSGFVKNITKEMPDKDIKVYNIENMETLNKFIEEQGGSL